MYLITFDKAVPRPKSQEHYETGYTYGQGLIARYGNDAVRKFRASQVIGSSYDQGAADAMDGKPSKYEGK